MAWNMKRMFALSARLSALLARVAELARQRAQDKVRHHD
jgi:hypothetical protein